MSAHTENGVQRLMVVLGDYTMPEAREILAAVDARLTEMSNASAPRPPDPTSRQLPIANRRPTAACKHNHNVGGHDAAMVHDEGRRRGSGNRHL